MDRTVKGLVAALERRRESDPAILRELAERLALQELAILRELERRSFVSLSEEERRRVLHAIARGEPGALDELLEAARRERAR